ncbi:MAG: carbohydrate ABC transporter permease, partial [Rhodoglobus sp.]
MSGFLKWIAQLPSLLQIPLVLLAFLAIAALVVFFIEIAPRAGRQYTIIRLVVCILAPLVVMLALGSVLWAAVVAAVLGGVFFLLDYRAKEGAGYLVQLFAFLSPAILLLLIGLVYPTVVTFFAAFLNNTGKRFVGLDNFVW